MDDPGNASILISIRTKIFRICFGRHDRTNPTTTPTEWWQAAKPLALLPKGRFLPLLTAPKMSRWVISQPRTQPEMPARRFDSPSDKFGPIST
jgi:hypothetical protein